MKNSIKNESSSDYIVSRNKNNAGLENVLNWEHDAQQEVIDAAKSIMRSRVLNSPYFDNPGKVKEYLIHHFASYKNEAFCVVYLSNQNQVIDVEELFNGTIDGSAVYPRVVLQKALEKNANAVIFAHNHPSGVVKPSQSDFNITELLKNALNMIEVRVLDHIIVGGLETYSFAEHGNI